MESLSRESSDFITMNYSQVIKFCVIYCFCKLITYIRFSVMHPNVFSLFQGPFKFLPDFKTPCWLSSNHELRCLPFFFLVGCPKCGTTDLFRMLKAHPDFRAFMKEPHWFTRRRFNTIVPYSFDKYTENMARPLSNLLKQVSKTAERNSSDDILQNRDADMKAVTQNVVLGKTMN